MREKVPKWRNILFEKSYPIVILDSFSGCLEIPSDTTFELADGVVLKKKDETNR